MFDIGWQEIFIIGVLAIIVVGPKDLPHALHTVVLWVRKARALVRDFQSGLDDIVNESGLEDIKRDAEKAASLHFQDEIEKVIDPDKELSKTLDLDEKKEDPDTRIAKAEDAPPGEASLTPPKPGDA